MATKDLEELTALMQELHDKAARYDWLCRHHAQGIGLLLGFSGKTTTTREIAERIDLFLNSIKRSEHGAH